MAFYNPTWLRKLIKEEADSISKYVTKVNSQGKTPNDFRGYIDAKMPFVLWLDIGEIATKVLEPNITLLNNTVNAAFDSSQVPWAKDTLTKVLLDAYKKTINQYIENPKYQEISYEQLSLLLEGLGKLNTGEIRGYLNTHFNRTMRVGGAMSQKNKRVMLISPSFTNIKFGTDFKSNIDYTPFGTSDNYTTDPISGELVESPYYKIKEILYDITGRVSGKKQDFFTQLQNVGHIEIDVVSSTTKEVKRSQVSPRFLQALVSVPNNPKVIQKLQVDFSTETLQHETRVTIRKNFSSGKLVFEMLVEHGFPVGIPESQLTNLKKATKEGSFEVGKGLTAQIRKDPSFLFELETSKSMGSYIFDNIKSLLSIGKNIPTYSSNTNFKESSKVTLQKVKLAKSNKRLGSSSKDTALKQPPAIRTTNGQFYSLANLQILINAQLQNVISANMGSGTDRNILNYRTGRFAASAQVERLSQSREGMISAFYSYMKNPYQTFEPGYAKGSPKTRDPKLLIGSSIKEIAATKVSNRMRAILV